MLEVCSIYFTFTFHTKTIVKTKSNYTNILHADLSEHLKHLGYPNSFPMSTLYTLYGSPQSFAIVADVLKWLATCLESDTILPGGISDETERILLIRSAAEFFVTKAGIKLNPRRLYASSAAAAAELLKITTLLMNAPMDVNADDEPLMVTTPIDLGDKVNCRMFPFRYVWKRNWAKQMDRF